MRESICTIPITEIFKDKDGCPLCRMHDEVEEHIISYIMSDAMMEPDIRIETNKLGFCDDHYGKMFDHKGRLQLALMLETHIKSISDEIFNSGYTDNGKYEAVKETNSTCFVCNKIEWGEKRMYDTLFRCYEKEPDFRRMFNSQPFYCLKHYERLMEGINNRKCRRYGGEMAQNLNRITKAYTEELADKITRYCAVYDYHHAGKNDFGDSRYAVHEIIKFLTMGQKGG